MRNTIFINTAPTSQRTNLTESDNLNYVDDHDFKSFLCDVTQPGL